MTPTVLSSSTLKGDEIVNTAGHRLGTLEEVMIDLTTGGVAYAVLARGGFAGMGRKLFAVPWQLISVDAENQRLVLDIEEQAIDEGPGFDPDNWPTLTEEWHGSVHRHFGVSPGWDPAPPLT